MLTALGSGILLGLSCGLAPGPLMALVLSQTLRHGRREGCKVALAPLITDAPIILAALALAARAAQMHRILGALSLAGGLFVLYLASDALRAVPIEAQEVTGRRPASWLKGVLTNLLSPHPWLFWMTVGAALLARSIAVSWVAAALFLAAFYLLLVGSKVALALAADRSRRFLTGRLYRFTVRALGVMLAVFGVLLLREGLRYLAPS